MSITITTWNVNSLKVRQPQVLDFLKETENSILCLQELKMQEADIDASAFKEIGYTLDAFGQKTYNGVATILRDPLTFLPDEEVRNIPGFEDPPSLRHNGAGRQRKAPRHQRILPERGNGLERKVPL